MPENGKYKTWLMDRILIKDNYSKDDIEEMDIEEYDFLILAALKDKKEMAKAGQYPGI